MLLAVLTLALPLGATACNLPGQSDPRERTVLIDYRFDQFAAVFDAYFPRTVSVHPGDTVVFKQAWNGEPHTVTMGTLVDEVFNPLWPVINDGPPFPAQPPNTPELKAAMEKFARLPAANAITPVALSQQGAQPCFVDSGTPGTDPNTPCPDQAPRAFNGRQAFYSSGVISSGSNVFRLPVAADTRPGAYRYYCTVHGPTMSAEVRVVAAGEATPSQTELNTQALRELDRYTGPLVTAYRDARAGRGPVHGNLAGVDAGPTVGASIAEFVPRTLKARANQKVTWHVVGNAHTISFAVPRYFPEINTQRDGTVQYNPHITDPIGAPGFPPPQPQYGSQRPAPINISAGLYDGGHFLSSGLGGGGGEEVNYTVIFTRPGKYKYACLVHPLMVGEVDVS